MPGEYDELYVVAREVLLDALEALGEHRQSIVLVGAQAIYLRTGEADLAVAPYTTDGDLGIDPANLKEIPPLEKALGDADFFPESDSSVGIWKTSRTLAGDEIEVQVDLLVPRSVSPGKGRRDARLPGHARRTARIVNGLEGTFVDHDEMDIVALRESDDRSLRVRVAGAAGLLVAKAFKIYERKDQEDRLRDKDALDVLRVLRGTDPDELVERAQRILSDEVSAEVATEGMAYLDELFRQPTSLGSGMAARAVGDLQDPDEIRQSCAALTDELLLSLEALLK
jgi:hypothetical protein